MTKSEKKKLEPTLEEKIQKLVRETFEVLAEAKDILKATKILNAKTEKDVREIKRANESLLSVVTKRFNEQNDMLSDTCYVTECAEDTLMNVLLAIRQNDYLQAWYPAQHGEAEMKVVGTHPAKLKNHKRLEKNKLKLRK